MRARGKKTGWSVRPLRALTLKMNDSLPECQSSSDWHQADNTAYTPLHKPWRLPFQTPPTISPLLSPSLSPYPSLPSVHLRGSSSTGIIPCCTEHPGPCKRISGSLTVEPAGPLSASNETYIRLQLALAVSLVGKQRKTIYLSHKKKKKSHLVKSQMYILILF